MLDGVIACLEKVLADVEVRSLSSRVGSQPDSAIQVREVEEQ
jgi:hypothetical protein